MKLLTQSGVGRQMAQISQVSSKLQVKFTLFVGVALVLIVSSLSGCAGLTGAAPSGKQGDPTAAVLSAGSGTLGFGNVPVGTTATQNLTVTNTGTAAANISQATISGTGFTVVGTVPSGSIAIGQAVTVQVQFAPQATGTASGTFTIASNASNSPMSVSLSGTGGAPGLSASPMSLSFGSIDIGTNSTKNVTLTNSGSSSVTISGVTASGSGITVSGTPLPATVNAGSTTTLTVQFTPTAAGSVSGSITIASNAPASPITVSVTGAGAQAQIAANPANVNFGNVVDGNANSQPIQVMNTGNSALTISQVAVTGGNNGFGISGLSTPLVIQAGKSATFNALFGPTSTGSVTGSISLVSNAPNSPMTINLSGAGATPTRVLSASTVSVSFGNVNEGTMSSQNVILTDTGNANVTISQVNTTGTGFSVSGINSEITLTPNQTVTLNVSFAPTSAGAVAGSTTITSNAGNAQLSISLSGTGVQATQHTVALAWTASSSSGIVGYNVYRGTQSGIYTKISSNVASTSYTDSTVISGQNTTYYYVVTSVNGNGTESSDSNQATATVP
jgi:Abnormal spindle-like microcephaly-assoc'd, ASPM-SPD-2-Hydin